MVYTPNCYENGGSLSHFEDQCQVPATFSLVPPTSNNRYFVMSSHALLGIMKRYPTHEERLTLCDLGYSTNTTYGSSAAINTHTYTGTCNSINVVGINDGLTSGFYTYTANVGASTATINPITNDFNATAFEVASYLVFISQTNHSIMESC